jgi:hypothetical protein
METTTMDIQDHAETDAPGLRPRLPFIETACPEGTAPMTLADEIRALVTRMIAEGREPGETPSPIELAIIQARSDLEVELLGRAMVARKRALPGGFGLRADPSIKRIAALLAC